jgi:hypothetical protein
MHGTMLVSIIIIVGKLVLRALLPMRRLERHITISHTTFVGMSQRA